MHDKRKIDFVLLVLLRKFDISLKKERFSFMVSNVLSIITLETIQVRNLRTNLENLSLLLQ